VTFRRVGVPDTEVGAFATVSAKTVPRVRVRCYVEAVLLP
jgi:hypothetical protein